MDSLMVLARKDLPPGWIDLSLGEPFLVQKRFDKHYGLLDIFKSRVPNVRYPHSEGDPELIDRLKERFPGNIIVTNGAKQALGAVFYSLKATNRARVGLPAPYWVSMPHIMAHEKLKSVIIDDPLHSISKKHKIKAMVVTSPNNPDGKSYPNNYMIALHAKYNAMNIKLIHDAAYYSGAYTTEKISALGDAQVFSFSKMYGLSGIRLGFIRTNDMNIYGNANIYMEKTTSGASTVSQDIVKNILDKEDLDPGLKKRFELDVFSDLRAAREAAREIPGLSDLNADGMFLWAKCEDIAAFERVKVKVLDGELFGKAGYIRINLAVGEQMIISVADRLKEGKV